MATRTIRVQVTSTAVPAWFANQTEKTWVRLNGSLLQSLAAPTYDGAYASALVSGVDDFSSGTVHERNQSLIVHGGGHGQTDNGVYEFSLLDTSNGGYPQWRALKTRHNRRYPDGYSALLEAERFNPTYFFDRSIATANDPYGAPFSSHTYNYVTYVPSQSGDVTQDSIWLPLMSGFTKALNAPTWMTSQSADNSVWRLQYDPAQGMQTWRILQRDSRYTTGAQDWQGFGPCLYNSEVAVPHLLRLKSGTGTGGRHFTISLTDGARTRLTTAPLVPAAMTAPMPARVATGQGFAAWISASTQKLYLIDLTNYSNALNNQPRTVANWPTGTWPEAHGAVWHDASNGFLLWGVTTLASGSTQASIWKLHQPQRNWWAGTWRCDEVTPAPSNAVTPEAQTYEPGRVYQRFNIIRDVGGSGNDALVLLNQSTQPVYVYKLPQGGL